MRNQIAKTNFLPDASRDLKFDLKVSFVNTLGPSDGFLNFCLELEIIKKNDLNKRAKNQFFFNFLSFEIEIKKSVR